VRRHSLQSLLDAPCGDFHWMRHVDWHPASDMWEPTLCTISSSITAANIRCRIHGARLLRDRLPDVDAWLARDLMIHFPDEAVRTAINQFRRPPSAISWRPPIRTRDKIRHQVWPGATPQPVRAAFGFAPAKSCARTTIRTPDGYRVWRRSDIE